jgi:hypothetical protein
MRWSQLGFGKATANGADQETPRNLMGFKDGTRNIDGSEESPIQLSFGFSLDRVGGIVGINRRADSEALRGAVRTGIAGDVLFAVRPPASPLTLVIAADHLFPFNRGTHLVGPSLKLSWLSFGPEGSLLGLDLVVIVEIPTGKVAILGVARASIPGLAFVLNLRLDVLGLLDPVEQIISIDASLVDSHVLGIFEVYGDAAMRFSWGASAYLVVTVGGFFPGFNPEPAHLPALRHVGLSIDNPISIISIRAEATSPSPPTQSSSADGWRLGFRWASRRTASCRSMPSSSSVRFTSRPASPPVSTCPPAASASLP